MVCGDARSPELYSRLLGGTAIDVVVADPPYNVKIAGHVSGRGNVRHAEFAFASGEMSGAEYTTFLADSLRLPKDYSRDGSIWFVFMDAAHAYELLDAARRIGVKLKTTCVWGKTNAGMGSLYRSQVEFVHVFKVGTAPHVNNVELGRYGRSRTTLWSYAGANTFRKGRMEDLEAHPTVKPLALVADAIRDVSNHGDVVLDPFLGSGTTILAAEKTGRIGRGIEFEPHYVDCAIQRWQAFTGRQARLAATGETFETIEEQRSGNAEPIDGKPATTPRPGRQYRPRKAS